MKTIQIVAAVGTLLAILLFLAIMQTVTNNRAQSRCDDAGGTYYRSTEPHRSLCRFPQK